MAGGAVAGTADEDNGGEFDAARAGDSAALGRLLESCRAYLVVIAEHSLAPDLVSKAGASDLVQETLLGASRDFARFTGRSRDELRAWLREILRNRLAALWQRYRDADMRRVSREVPAGDPTAGGPWDVLADVTPAPVIRAMRAEAAAALRAALGRLPEEYRRVIVWHQYDGLTFGQIGGRLGRSDEAARKLWSRALLRLAEDLGPAHAP